MTTSPVDEDLKKLLGDTLAISYHGQADFDWEQVDLCKNVSGNDSDYIIYTSGTTGIAKGVEVTHDNLASFTDWMNQDFQKIEHNHFLEQALYSFDLSIFSIYPCLTTGGTLVLYHERKQQTLNACLSEPITVKSILGFQHLHLSIFVYLIRHSLPKAP